MVRLGEKEMGLGLEDWLLSLFGPRLLQPGGQSSRFIVFSCLYIRSPIWNQGELSNKKCVQIFVKMLI